MLIDGEGLFESEGEALSLTLGDNDGDKLPDNETLTEGLSD